MEMRGDKIVSAVPSRVFAALNDLEVLRVCIPGCESLEKISDNDMRATVRLSIGPIKTVFNGEVTLSDMNPPHSYTISGKGGAAVGIAEGSAKVSLSEHPQGTLLDYAVQAKVGGKIAQLGSRLIDSVASKLATQFFDAFALQLSDGQNNSENNSESKLESESDSKTESKKSKSKNANIFSPRLLWTLGGAAILMLLAWSLS